jgi:inosose dehydratase
VEYKDELEDVRNCIDPKLLGGCLDIGHIIYAGFDPVAFYRRHSERISYLHFKDVNPIILRQAIDNRTGFYDACAAGVFCNLGEGIVDFLALKSALLAAGFSGWGTVEQDRDPKGARSTLVDATANLNFLKVAGLA